MSHLKLVPKKKDLSMALFTDNLIESAFGFISHYVGLGTQIEDIYNSAILLMDAQLLNGYGPRSDIYMCDLDLRGKYVSGDLSQDIRRFQIALEDEPLTRIRNIKNSLSDLDDDIYYHLDEQEILDYASHMFLDCFLQFFDTGRSSVKFPHPIEVLRRKNLEPIVKEVLMNKSKFVFLANNDSSVSRAVVGIKR